MIVETIINEKLSIWFDQNPSVSKIIIAKIIQAAMARDVARKARESVRRRCSRIKWLARKISRLSNRKTGGNGIVYS